MLIFVYSTRLRWYLSSFCGGAPKAPKSKRSVAPTLSDIGLLEYKSHETFSFFFLHYSTATLFWSTVALPDANVLYTRIFARP